MLATATNTELRAKLFRGFADPARLAILETLSRGPHCVNDIVEATGLSQSNVSNHLACLKDCGLAACQRDGRHVYYAVSDARVHTLMATADELLSEVAGGVAGCPRYLPAASDD